MKCVALLALVLLSCNTAFAVEWLRMREGIYIDADSFKEIRLTKTGPTVAAWFKTTEQSARISSNPKVAENRIHLEVFCGKPVGIRELAFYSYDASGNVLVSQTKPMPGIASPVPESTGEFMASRACRIWVALSKANLLDSQVRQPNAFRGYACKDDCSGHAAGYNWAQRKDIDDEDDCTGRSRSFIEGCIAYVEERR